MLLVGILVGFLVFSAVSFIFSRGGPSGNGQGGLPSSIEFEFLYTSEKQGWIEEVTPDFEEWFFERFNITVDVRLIVTGSHDSVNLLLWESVQPAAWSPASSIWIPYLNFKWQEQGHEGEIAEDWTPLVLSPVVIAGWSSFLQKYNVSSFRDLYNLAVDAVDYKYGHPDPELSNGGAMTVTLEFAEAAGKKPNQFIADDFRNETVLDFVTTIESRAVYYGKSTGFFGKWAADSGPSAIDCFSVYESVVLANSLKAKTRWENDSLVAVYPQDGTLLSDHPYVMLNASWVSNWQKFAAAQYLFYLLESQTQEKAQRHGFRPANPSVPLDDEVFNEENGVQYEIQVPILKPLSGEAMDILFTVWYSVKHPGV
jgi:Ca-activated chloride channel family protein